MYNYDQRFAGYRPELSRRAALEKTFHVDSEHPARRVMFEIGMVLVPLGALALLVGAVAFFTTA